MERVRVHAGNLPFPLSHDLRIYPGHIPMDVSSAKYVIRITKIRRSGKRKVLTLTERFPVEAFPGGRTPTIGVSGDAGWEMQVEYEIYWSDGVVETIPNVPNPPTVVIEPKPDAFE